MFGETSGFTQGNVYLDVTGLDSKSREALVAEAAETLSSLGSLKTIRIFEFDDQGDTHVYPQATTEAFNA